MPLQIPQQELFSPVTNYYKGKAIRQDLATAKKQEELLDLKIAEAKKPPQVDPKEQRDQSKFVQESVANSFATSMVAMRENPELSDQEYTSLFDTALTQALGPEAAAEMRPVWDKNGDGILGPKERAEGEAFTTAYMEGLAESGGDANPQQTEFIGDDGKAHVGTYNPNTQLYTDSSGKEHKNAKPIAGAATQEELSGAGTDRTAARQVREVMGSTDNLLDAMERISDLVDAAPQASLGLPGGTSGLIDRAISAANGFAEIAGGWSEVEGGGKVEPDALLDLRLYADFFEGASGMNAALQANAVGVAYALARAANPDGRISDADVRHQLERLQLNQSSKTRIKSAIHEVKRSQLGSAMNWLRTSGATKTSEGREAFTKYETALNVMDNTTSKSAPPGYSGPTAFDANGNLLILNEDGSDWILAQ